jgi:hypothetical protein
MSADAVVVVVQIPDMSRSFQIRLAVKETAEPGKHVESVSTRRSEVVSCRLI